MNTLDSYLRAPPGQEACSSAESSPALGGTFTPSGPSSSTNSFSPCRNAAMPLVTTFRLRSSPAMAESLLLPLNVPTSAAKMTLRGFDIRTVSPIAYLPSAQTVALRNPMAVRSRQSSFPRDRSPARGACVRLQLLEYPGSLPAAGHSRRRPQLHGNVEYRITIAGPVAIAPFVDVGTDPILRTSQLQINPVQYETLQSTLFGCPILGPQTSATRVPGGNSMSTGKVSAAESPARSRHQLGCAYVHRTRIADHASGSQCALPHLLRLQRLAPRWQRHAPRADHPSMFPSQMGSSTGQDRPRAYLHLWRDALDSRLHIHPARTAKDLPLFGGDRSHNVLRPLLSSRLSVRQYPPES
jgi:hypothetical protein